MKTVVPETVLSQHIAVLGKTGKLRSLELITRETEPHAADILFES